VQTPTLHLELESAILSVFGKPMDSFASLQGSDRRKAELQLAKQISNRRVFAVHQVHGDSAVRIESSAAEPDLFFADADALFTSETGVCLLIRTADCLPLFFSAKSKTETTVGIIHAVWRGLAAGIVRKTIARVADESGPIENLTLVPGPCISGKNYEVGPEVAERFEIHARIGEKFRVDLIENAILETRKAGIATQIELIDAFMACTVDKNALYFSHRKGDEGRNLNLIYKR